MIEMSLSRHHFIEAAKIIKSIPDKQIRQDVADKFASLFAASNPRFDYLRFHKASDTKA
jgi:hypothetical protein